MNKNYLVGQLSLEEEILSPFMFVCFFFGGAIPAIFEGYFCLCFWDDIMFTIRPHFHPSLFGIIPFKAINKLDAQSNVASFLVLLYLLLVLQTNRHQPRRMQVQHPYLGNDILTSVSSQQRSISLGVKCYGNLQLARERKCQLKAIVVVYSSLLY